MTKAQKRDFENRRDSELIKRHKEGDTTAFPELVKVHFKELTWYNYKKLHNYQEAEDAAQEELVNALEAINSGKYVEKGMFGGWLRKSASFFLSKKKRKIKVKMESMEELPDILFDLQAIEMEDEREEALKLVMLAIKKLPAKDLEIIQLRYWEKLSWKRIGEIFDQDQNTLSGRHSRIIIKIKTLVNEIILSKNNGFTNFRVLYI